MKTDYKQTLDISFLIQYLNTNEVTIYATIVSYPSERGENVAKLQYAVVASAGTNDDDKRYNDY